MRVGLDYRPALYGRGGIGAYVRALVSAYGAAFPAEPLRLYAHRLRDRGRRRDPGALPPAARLCEGPLPITVVEALARVGLGADRLLGGVDVLHWTDYVRLPSTRAPVVATVHDVLFTTLPACYTSGMRRGLTRHVRRVLACAARVLVPSERTKRDLCLFHGADPARVDVAPLGVEAPPPTQPVRDLARYVLLLGTREPRKNAVRTLEALDRVRSRGLEVGAVLVGGAGWREGPLAAALAARPWARVEGEVDDARKHALLAGAAALAYPSLGEGFGLPVLEGCAAGVPVLVGAGTACSDLAGDAALAADPWDVAALAGALERLLTDAALRAGLVERGRALAALHTWERTARATRACYERALAA